MTNDRTGLLIIRVSVEHGSAEPLRAHIRLTTDVCTGFERTLTVARTDEVLATVDQWLGDMLAKAAE